MERAQVRSAEGQTCPIVQAFVRLEAPRLQTGISGFAAKTNLIAAQANLIREAIRLYLQKPSIILQATA